METDVCKMGCYGMKKQHNSGTSKNSFCASRRTKMDQKRSLFIFHKNKERGMWGRASHFNVDHHYCNESQIALSDQGLL